MARKVYSTYEAKTKLSELLDRVGKGDVVTITRRGKPVAEVRSVEGASDDPTNQRIDDLRRRGLISAPGKKGPFKPLAHRPGGLKRFFDDRE